MKENNKVVIYTSSLCGFCYKAKILLNNYNIEFSEINIVNDKLKDILIIKNF